MATAEIASATSSPLPESIFDEDWKNCGGDDMGLEAIAAFNASFDNVVKDQSKDDNAGIDPQVLSTVASPASTTPEATFEITTGHNGLLSTTYSSPTDFKHATTPPAGSPYFCPSIEKPDPCLPPYAAPPLRNQLHRRSVSEPPVGHPEHIHLLPPHPAQILPTFIRRDGTEISKPRFGVVPKSKPKHAANRQHPYQRPLPAVQGQGQERYHLRRSHTQPVRHGAGPTSVPPPLPPPQGGMMMMVQQPFVPSPAPQFVSSRVCTPSPTRQQVGVGGSPGMVDPRLASPFHGAVVERKDGRMAIPVSVEELRTMITEAVNKAVVESSGGRNAVVGQGAVQARNGN